MDTCAKCETATPTHWVSVVKYYNPEFGFWLDCESTPVKICKPCLLGSLEVPNIKLKFEPLTTVRN